MRRGRADRGRGTEQPAYVGDRAALRPEARCEDRAVERQVLVGRPDRRADHRPEGAQRVGAGVEPAQVVEHQARDRAVLDPGVLDLGALLVRGERQDEQPRAMGPGGLDERVQRAEAEERADRDRVRGERRGRVEVGVGVRLAGGSDVAALDVQQHQRPGGPGLRDHPLEDRDPPAAEALEERRLGLDHRDVRRDRVHDREREGLEAGDVVLEAPVLQQPGVRVDADAERSAVRDRNVEAAAERAHRTPLRMRRGHSGPS